MSIAMSTADLGANHAMAGIPNFLDGGGNFWGVIAGPTAAGIKLSF